MVIPSFLANTFSPLDFSFFTVYPHHVPSVHECYTYFPSFSGNTDRRPDQHLKDFHECTEQLGIVFRDVKMKIFMYYLEGNTRLWYKTIPHGNISS